MNKLIAPW